MQTINKKYEIKLLPAFFFSYFSQRYFILTHHLRLLLHYLGIDFVAKINENSFFIENNMRERVLFGLFPSKMKIQFYIVKEKFFFQQIFKFRLYLFIY